jgi:hypothetical protein
MADVGTAKTLALVGGILSVVFGVVYFLWGIALAAMFYNTYNNYYYSSNYWTGIWILLGLPWVIYGIISLIFGILTLAVARKRLFEASTLKTGAIMCFIFGGISAAAIGGALTIVGGILAILAWNDEQRKAGEAQPSVPPPPPPA